MSEWHRLGVVGLKLAYAHGQTNPVALAGHQMDRIDRLNPRINVFLDLDRDGLIDAAHASLGRLSEDAALPLEGLPVAVAADIAMKGLDHSAALEARKGMVAEQDSALVSRLRDAGALMIGTLNMDEARLGLRSNNPWTGRIFNPHGDGLSPGGASGGVAAAVASGFAIAALGGDTLGAIRLPAALCGAFALRPTPGSVPLDGLVALSPILDSVALAARSMDDLNALATVIAPPDLSTAMQRCRFAILDGVDRLALDADVRAHYDYAVSMLPEPPVTLALPAPLADIAAAATRFVEWQLTAQLVPLGEERCQRLSDRIASRIEQAVSRDPSEARDDLDLLRLSGKALREGLGRNKVLLTPAAPSVAQPHDDDLPQGFGDLVVLPDVAGLPAVIIPAGRSPANLPVGLQIIGPQGCEAMLLAQARMLNDRIRGYAPPASWW